MKTLLQEFKPALLFVAKFVVIYLAGNILYGIWIESLGNACDPITILASEQSANLLNLFKEDVQALVAKDVSKTYLITNNDIIVSVYEGCNGLNVIIVFVSFLVSYGGKLKSFLWFVPLGILVIHGLNLARIVLLYNIAKDFPSYMYFTHKYLFTGFIYLGVVILWYFWAAKVNE